MIGGRLLGKWADGSPEWHAAREGRIGASEIAAVCGWSPYDTRDDLLARKATGARLDVTDAMQRGHLVEPAIVAWLTDRLDLTDVQPQPGTYVDPLDDRWSCNPDGLARLNGRAVLLEAKSVADRATENGWGRAGSDVIPLHYEAQVKWQLGVMALHEAYVGVLHGATNGRPDLAFHFYRLTASPAAYAYMRVMAARFMADLADLNQGDAA